MKGRSLRAAIDAHCRECGACDAGANWREHVSCCVALSCPIWPVRPLSRYAPAWIARREPEGLPDGWCKLPLEDALARLRNPASSGPRDGKSLSCDAKPARNGAMGPSSSIAHASDPLPVLNGGAR